tara:strand:- start:348 stop:776 length:429 start_codon:yes stop_codon:yes gene_type:complete
MYDSIIQDLILIASKVLGVNIKDKSRTQPHVRGRFIVYSLLRAYLDLNYQEIAKIFDLKSHASVIHGVKELPFLIKYDPKVGEILQEIRYKWTEEYDMNSVKVSNNEIKNLEDKIILLNLELKVYTERLQKLKNNTFANRTM